jgi:hypothetical protein
MLYSRLQRHRLQHPEHAIELLLLAVRDEGSARELSDVEEEDVSIRGETIRPPLGGWRGLGKGGDEGFELIGEEGVIGENEEHGEGFEDGALHDMLDVKDLAKGCKRKANEDDRWVRRAIRCGNRFGRWRVSSSLTDRLPFHANPDTLVWTDGDELSTVSSRWKGKGIIRSVLAPERNGKGEDVYALNGIEHVTWPAKGLGSLGLEDDWAGAKPPDLKSVRSLTTPSSKTWRSSQKRISLRPSSNSKLTASSTNLVRVRNDIAQRLRLLHFRLPLCLRLLRVRPEDIRPSHDAARLNDVRKRVDELGVRLGDERVVMFALVLPADDVARQGVGRSVYGRAEVADVEEGERDGLQKREMITAERQSGREKIVCCGRGLLVRTRFWMTCLVWPSSFFPSLTFITRVVTTGENER